MSKLHKPRCPTNQEASLLHSSILTNNVKATQAPMALRAVSKAGMTSHISEGLTLNQTTINSISLGTRSRTVCASHHQDTKHGCASNFTSTSVGAIWTSACSSCRYFLQEWHWIHTWCLLEASVVPPLGTGRTVCASHHQTRLPKWVMHHSYHGNKAMLRVVPCLPEEPYLQGLWIGLK